MMHCSLSREELAAYVARQMWAFLPDREVAPAALASALDAALERLEHAITHNRQRYLHENDSARFDHRNTDQYAMFLYLLSNALFRAGELDLAPKAYALNKALHALDAFYEVELPAIFAFQHPVGTVLGRARYADYLYVYQRCSVGTSMDGHSPEFGEGVVLFGGSSVIGNVRLGDNVWVSVNALVMGGEIPPNSLVFGSSPHLTVRPTTRSVRRDMFRTT